VPWESHGLQPWEEVNSERTPSSSGDARLPEDGSPSLFTMGVDRVTFIMLVKCLY